MKTALQHVKMRSVELFFVYKNPLEEAHNVQRKAASYLDIGAQSVQVPHE